MENIAEEKKEIKEIRKNLDIVRQNLKTLDMAQRKLITIAWQNAKVVSRNWTRPLTIREIEILLEITGINPDSIL